MLRRDHPLLSCSLGVQKTLSSLHFGQPGAGPKVYIQASLHAEELPGMLVAYHLRALLEAAEAANQLRGELVLVPVANPIGLAQRLDHKAMGRFELDSSENFNRHYPNLAEAVAEPVLAMLGPDAERNVRQVRAAMGTWLQQWQANTELQSLRRTLLLLAHDADWVLDLHCDCEAILHAYTEQCCWPSLEPLTRCLGAQVVLLAKNSGSNPFDECLSGAWWRLAEALGPRLPTTPLPQGCHSVTVELRGEAQVNHALARADAQAIWAFLRHIAIVDDGATTPLPEARCNATPLAGSETLHTPVAGVVVFAAEPGQTLQAGALVAEVIDPLSARVHAVRAGVSGMLYARIRERYAHAGAELAKIAGATAFRCGELLGA